MAASEPTAGRAAVPSCPVFDTAPAAAGCIASVRTSQSNSLMMADAGWEEVGAQGLTVHKARGARDESTCLRPVVHLGSEQKGRNKQRGGGSAPAEDRAGDLQATLSLYAGLSRDI